ncbi:MAG: hypothetical protein INF91_07650 [Alphaproteobacteria bacterium]|nr:hypothetical protein [Alphaproteobacteria bacterium]
MRFTGTARRASERLSRAAILSLPLIIAACGAPAPRQAPPPAPVAQAPAAPPVTACVDLARIAEARVRDDRTIDFVLRDGAVLRNSLPNACPGLGAERAFTYATSLTRLCATDTVTVVQQGGGPRLGASCGLGGFTPAPATGR